MSDAAAVVWDGRSVLFTSFWGWSPETWGTVGWTKEIGRGRRDKLCRELTDPFIVACYVTLSAPDAEAYERGKITGFYLVSHETGDRDEFTHPVHHSLQPEKWRHSLRALRGFNYLPEYRLDIRQFDPAVLKRAQPVAAMGEIVTDARRLALLRETPWEEVPVYRPRIGISALEAAALPIGWVRAGPENQGGYSVPPMTQALTRHLYILRLDGPTDALLLTPANGRHIIKIGLAASPESRRTQFQAALPRSALCWNVYRTTFNSIPKINWTFAAAVAGEYAMKVFLAAHAEHLDGEFYLASEVQIDEAWRLGTAAAQLFRDTEKQL